MTVAMDVSVPSNLSGLVILIDSGIFDDCSDWEGVSGLDCVSDSVAFGARLVRFAFGAHLVQFAFGARLVGLAFRW